MSCASELLVVGTACKQNMNVHSCMCTQEYRENEKKSPENKSPTYSYATNFFLPTINE